MTAPDSASNDDRNRLGAGRTSEATTGDNTPDEGVTAVLSRLVRPGREAEYEAWSAGISEAARQFPGHRGVTILRPHPDTRPEYVIILHFDRYANLCAWIRSDMRRQWLERAKPLTQADQYFKVLTGLENFVTLPHSTDRPPRYKTAAVTWLGVFVCSSLLSIALGPLLGTLPFLLRQAIATGITVCLLAYLVMPVLTRLFYRWLHPRA